jgi:hypothetical protein
MMIRMLRTMIKDLSLMMMKKKKEKKVMMAKKMERHLVQMNN